MLFYTVTLFILFKQANLLQVEDSSTLRYDATGSSLGLCLIHYALTTCTFLDVKKNIMWLVLDKNPEVKLHNLQFYVIFTASLMCYDYRRVV